MYSIAGFFLSFSVAAFVMAEYGLTSLYGNWQPTHETAITSGVLSIAFATLANRNK